MRASIGPCKGSVGLTRAAGISAQAISLAEAESTEPRDTCAAMLTEAMQFLLNRTHGPYVPVWLLELGLMSLRG